MDGATPPFTALAHMDDEQLIDAVRSAHSAAARLLNLANTPQADSQDALAATVRELAEATHAAICFMPAAEDADRVLLGAVAAYL